MCDKRDTIVPELTAEMEQELSNGKGEDEEEQE